MDELKLAPEYDPWITAKKVLGRALTALAPLAAAAAVAWLSVPENVQAVTHSWGPYAGLGTVVILAVARGYDNWRKNRDR